MDEEVREVEILDKAICYQGFFRMERYRLRHSLFAGGMSTPMIRELFERGHAAVMLPYDPDRDEVVLLEQFRIGALEAPGGAWLWEFVAGMIEPGETPEEVVMREAMEESGCEVLALEHICDYLVSPGGTSERISLYCGRVDAREANGIHGLDSEHEDIRVTALPYAEVMGMLQEGKINSASPIIGLQWLQMNRHRLQLQWR